MCVEAAGPAASVRTLPGAGRAGAPTGLHPSPRPAHPAQRAIAGGRRRRGGTAPRPSPCGTRSPRPPRRARRLTPLGRTPPPPLVGVPYSGRNKNSGRDRWARAQPPPASSPTRLRAPPPPARWSTRPRTPLPHASRPGRPRPPATGPRARSPAPCHHHPRAGRGRNAGGTPPRPEHRPRNAPTAGRGAGPGRLPGAPPPLGGPIGRRPRRTPTWPSWAASPPSMRARCAPGPW